MTRIVDIAFYGLETLFSATVFRRNTFTDCTFKTLKQVPVGFSLTLNPGWETQLRQKALKQLWNSTIESWLFINAYYFLLSDFDEVNQIVCSDKVLSPMFVQAVWHNLHTEIILNKALFLFPFVCEQGTVCIVIFNIYEQCWLFYTFLILLVLFH